MPDRAGQPTLIQLHMTLDQLRGLNGAGAAEAAWAARGPAAAPGSDCDATIVPVVSGHVDPAVLDQLTAALLRHDPALSRRHVPGPPGADPAFVRAVPARPVRAAVPQSRGRAAGDPAACRGSAVRPGRAGRVLAHRPARRRGRQLSLPLDVGRATKTIPDHLRRAVIARDRCCRFPGCRQRPAACQAHHVKPRSQGGTTSLNNLILLCAFHHLTAIHRWGWHLTLHPDGTTTATSPDQQRTLNSHGPPARAA